MSTHTEFTDWHSYLYDNGTLRNSFGIEDAERLAEIEREFSEPASDFFHLHPLDVTETTVDKALRRIHNALFGAVYEWAGLHRSVTIGKKDSLFLGPQNLSAELTELDEMLALRKYFRHVKDATTFAENITLTWGVINNVHPFREGNGRTCRIYLDALAGASRKAIDWSVMTESENISVSRSFGHGNHEPMLEAATRMIHPIEGNVSAAIPLSREQADTVIRATNANNRLEAIPSKPDCDDTRLRYLTGLINETEMRQEKRHRILSLAPEIDPRVLDTALENVR